MHKVYMSFGDCQYLENWKKVYSDYLFDPKSETGFKPNSSIKELYFRKLKMVVH